MQPGQLWKVSNKTSIKFIDVASASIEGKEKEKKQKKIEKASRTRKKKKKKKKISRETALWRIIRGRFFNGVLPYSDNQTVQNTWQLAIQRAIARP